MSNDTVLHKVQMCVCACIMGRVNKTITIDPRHSFFLDESEINLSKKVRKMLDSEIEDSEDGGELVSYEN